MCDGSSSISGSTVLEDHQTYKNYQPIAICDLVSKYYLVKFNVIE